MPAFGPTHKDEEIWKIVAFVRHLPELPPEEQKALRGAGAASADALKPWRRDAAVRTTSATEMPPR